MTRLKALREELELRQVDVAARLHVAQSTLSGWESDTHMPDLANLYTLAAMYDTSLDYMLGYSTQRKVDVGKPERLLREYLRSQHDLDPESEQQEVLAGLIATGVKMIRMR